MGSIEKRGENSWRVGFRRSSAEGRGWVRKTITYPPTMSEEEQRKACELELARLMVQDAADQASPPRDASTASPMQALIDKYHISPQDAAMLTTAAPSARPSEGGPVTVQQLYDMWMSMHCVPYLKPTTVKTYQNLMSTRVLPLIGKCRVIDLTPMDMERLMASIRMSGKRSTGIDPDRRKRRQDRSIPLRQAGMLSDRTLQHYHDAISAMFDQGVKWELFPANPFAKVTRPTARKKHKLQVLDDQRAVELLRCLEAEDSMSFRSAVMLALLCGLRLSEVGGLTWADVDFDQCTITISRGLNYTPAMGNYIDTPKSEDSERTIDLPAGMMTMLEETRSQQEEHAVMLGNRWRGIDRIVCSWDGTPYHHDTPSKQFRKFADRHGYQGIRFHDLRHSHATLLLANNIDAVAVAHRLGHASPDTTYRYYAHAIRSRDVASAQTMQRYIEQAAGDGEDNGETDG